MGKYSSFDRCLLRGSELTIGGPGTTDTKMPEELFDRRTHVVFSHRNTHLWQTHPRMQTTPTLRAPSRISAGIIALLLFLFASGLQTMLQKSRRDGRGRGRDKGGSRAGCNEAPPTLRNQRLVAGKQKTQMSL